MRKVRLPRLDALFALPRRRADRLPDLIVVGLGNPGSEYAQTRHNVGAWCVDRIAKDYAITMSRRHRTSLIGEGVIDGRRVALARPRTFVNLSGRSATYLLARYRVPSKRLLVIYDEMDLAPGTIRLRPGGSGGGHNGIKSIIAALGTQEFPRLRVGIGRPEPGADRVDYVLGTMSPDERGAVDDSIGRAVQAVVTLLTEGIDVAMNRFN